MRRADGGVSLWMCCVAGCLLLWCVAAEAMGPRWVTGPPYFTGKAGVPVVWYTPTPLYFTDPGDLSVSVDHAAADAMVKAAASVWNVPTSRMDLEYGGALSEHVSGADAYLDVDGPVFPADVQSSNYAAKQIAVIYDADGSVTDMLLGGGASSPAECRQNGVTEDVDSIVPAGFIQHAVIVLNGRCTGPAPEQQLQMQYQLERVFGRVLGIGWSQTNDNVFTRTPVATSLEAMHWPIMHPIDIVCGDYTYQCLPSPFTLRDDDVAAISSLYVIGLSTYLWGPTAPPPPGKIPSYTEAARVDGHLTFPTGQGMAGVNVLVRRGIWFQTVYDGFYDTSSVSGFLFRRNSGNSVSGPAAGMAGSNGAEPGDSSGASPSGFEGYFDLDWITDYGPSEDWFDVIVTTEPINALYRGAYSVGPYVAQAVAPSGSPFSQTSYGLGRNLWVWADLAMAYTPPDGASGCATGGDGTEAAPVAVAAGGWWMGTLCAYGHTAWSSFAAKAGRTATLEVTALDESGLATTAKAMPLMGVWGAADATGTLPTVAATASAFNSVNLGMTTLGVATGAAAQTMRFVVADERGDGRPDYGYKARVLYADTVAPASLSASGGVVTIMGMGFRPGNKVTIGGATALVTSWTATQIVAVAPVALHAGAVDVAVTDLSTGGSTVMSGAVTYDSSSTDLLTVVSAPSGPVSVGTAAATAFAVRVVLGDGVTPGAGLPVVFSVASGTASFGGCGTAACTVTTDATGLASMTVTPTAYGTVTLTAAAVGQSVAASFLATTPDVVRLVSAPSGTVAVGAAAATPLAVQVLLGDGVTPVAGYAVVFSVTGGAGMFGACGAATCTVLTDATGVASTAVTGTAYGTVAVQASAVVSGLTETFRASFLATAPDVLRLVAGPSGTIAVGVASAFSVRVLLGDGTTAAPGVPVVFSVVSGSAGFACGGASCTVLTDATGLATTAVTGTAYGMVTVQAAAAGSAVRATFMATAPNVVSLVSGPSGVVPVGTVAGTAFALRVLLGDGVTPAVGVPVVLSATAGSVAFGACGAAVCSVVTDASGQVSTTVTPTAFGTVTVQGAVAGQVVSASFLAVVRSVVMVRGIEYVAAGTTVVWAPQVMVVQNGVPAAGVAVIWSGGGMGPGGTTTVSNGAGVATAASTVGPLAAGASATGTVCAWGTVCASFSATGVDAAEWQLAVVSGAGQTVAVGAAFAPVVLRVVDASGDWVAGATVSVHQTVDAGEMPCPVRGRCPVAPVLGSGSATLVSDADGLVSVTPMQVAGVAEVTNLAASAGTQGFLSMAIAVGP